MFPDSETAKHFACGERKAAHLAAFGIAPHFLSLLKGKVRDQSKYVLLFDESLNSEMQSKQLDVLVRYWNADKVESRYFTSYFWAMQMLRQYITNLNQFVLTLAMRSLLNFPWMVLM